MRLLIGVIISLLVRIGRLVSRIPTPSPPVLPGAILVVLGEPSAETAIASAPQEVNTMTALALPNILKITGEDPLFEAGDLMHAAFAEVKKLRVLSRDVSAYLVSDPTAI